MFEAHSNPWNIMKIIKLPSLRSLFLGAYVTANILIAQCALADQIRVACVGDSITYGHFVSGASTYPSKLQAALGSGYYVQNFGVSGSSLLKLSGGNPAYHPAWIDTAAYAQAMNSAPNVVIIMLGANDASFWNNYSSLFVSQFESLVNGFRALPTKPEVFVCKPTYCFGANSFGIDANIVDNVIPPLIDTIAANTKSPVIDMKAATYNGGNASYFPDNVHPIDAGAQQIADAAKTALQNFKLTRAFYIKTDSATQGSWKSTYGVQGFCTSQDSSTNNPGIPANVSWSIVGQGNQQWSAATGDVRALQQAQTGSTNRIAGRWSSSNTSGSSYDINLNFTDGQTHQVALYGLDWETANQRNQTVQVIEVATNRILDTRTLTSFTNGKYLVWNVTGNLKFRVVSNSNYGAAISGIFIDPVKIPIGQLINLKSKANNLFVSADNGGNSPLIANRTSAGGWEQFLVVDASLGAGNGIIGLQAMANYRYVCADMGIANPPQPIANRTSVGGAWECFVWTPQADGSVGIQAQANNKFITVNPSAPTLTASQTAIGGAWEVFNWNSN
jgi:lysophospholipase L1-like esterase